MSQIPTPPPIATCLFTGEALGPTTKVEHTIPESLGGRIKSRTVSSSTFNERAGSTIDKVLAAAYAHLFNRLSPLLPSKSSEVSFLVRVPDSTDRFSFGPGGILTLQNVRIIERDSNDRPKVAAATNEEALIRLAKQLGRDVSTLTFTTARATEEEIVYADVIPIAREIELAALKAILLTFDSVLEADPSRRFTRSVALAPIREILRRAVVEGTVPSAAEMNDVVLGLQYDRLDTVEKLRGMVPVPASDFEHVLIASGNVATRTVDALWSVAGTDPQAYRLSRDWRDYDFTCVVVSGTLRGTETYPPCWLQLADGLTWQYTNFRSHPTLDGMTQEAAREYMKKVMARVGQHRLTAFRKAVDLVERTADDYVVANTEEMARLTAAESGSAPTVEAGVTGRLSRMFHLRLSEPSAKVRFETIVKKHLDDLPAAMRLETIAAPANTPPSWTAWLKAERAILDDLAPVFGLPGGMLTRNIEAVLELPGHRPLGMPPRPPASELLEHFSAGQGPA